MTPVSMRSPSTRCAPPTDLLVFFKKFKQKKPARCSIVVTFHMIGTCSSFVPYCADMIHMFDLQSTFTRGAANLGEFDACVLVKSISRVYVIYRRVKRGALETRC